MKSLSNHCIFSPVWAIFGVFAAEDSAPLIIQWCIQIHDKSRTKTTSVKDSLDLPIELIKIASKAVRAGLDGPVSRLYVNKQNHHLYNVHGGSQSVQIIHFQLPLFAWRSESPEL